MELIGVVPSVDMIENATPNDIMNNPKVNEQILLSMYSNYVLHLFKLTSFPVMQLLIL